MAEEPTLEALLEESRRFPPPEEFREDALVSDASVYDRAAEDPEAFWAAVAHELD